MWRGAHERVKELRSKDSCERRSAVRTITLPSSVRNLPDHSRSEYPLSTLRVPVELPQSTRLAPLEYPLISLRVPVEFR